MDDLAKAIGWTVIVVGVVYIVGKIIISLGEQKRREDELVLSTWDHERRLAFRRIWQSTDDPRVHEDVKFQYGPWALLELELNDDEYDRKMASSESVGVYLRARQNVRSHGYAYDLQDGKIVSRPRKLEA